MTETRRSVSAEAEPRTDGGSLPELVSDPPAAARTWPPRWLRRGYLPVALAILLAAFTFVPLPRVPELACCAAFVEVPGSALPLAARVTVDDPAAQDVDGEYLLMTVSLRPATGLGWVRAHLFADTSLLPRGRLVPAEVNDREYFRRQRTVFDTSAAVAAAVGLERAGYAVDPSQITGDGALVVRLLDGAPADGRLRPGDVIVAVDDRPIRVAEELRPLVDNGGTRQLSVRRGSVALTVPVTPGTISVDGEDFRGIGVEVQTANPRIELPIDVQVDAGRIGGPSAGLLIALTVYDKVDPVDLAAGRRVAGTGTIAPDGTVGRIGGIRQKVVAAHRERADVFMAPASQADDARHAVPRGSDLQVIAVRDFRDAVAALEGR
jgi:PDZ domain-containing protein